jgi:chromosome segregation ATPase
LQCDPHYHSFAIAPQACGCFLFFRQIWSRRQAAAKYEASQSGPRLRGRIMGLQREEAAMEFVERLGLLEERYDDLARLIKDKHAIMLDRHTEQLRELRQEVANLGMKIALLEERVKFLAERLDLLAKRIDMLEKRVDALEAQLLQLERQVQKMDARVRRVEVLQWVVIALVVPQTLIFYLRLLSP